MKRSTSESEGSMCIEEQEPEVVAAPSKVTRLAVDMLLNDTHLVLHCTILFH
jgi:hypothetical protein